MRRIVLLFLFYSIDSPLTLYNGLLMRERRNIIYGKELYREL